MLAAASGLAPARKAGQRPWSGAVAGQFLKKPTVCVSSRPVGSLSLGEIMKKIVLIAALVAAAAAPPGWAASSCPSSGAAEAEAAIRYVTDLMVISSVCQDTVYAEFRLRNQTQIMAYQKALMAQFHGAAGFDRWNTALANQAAQKQNGNQQLCQQSVALLQQAKALDANGFRAYAAAQAAAAAPTAKCGK
jgi:hypothetical protein